MKEYIKTLMNEKGYEITPDAVTVMEFLITKYTENITKEALHISSYHYGHYGKPVNKLNYNSINVLLRVSSKQITRDTLIEAAENI